MDGSSPQPGDEENKTMNDGHQLDTINQLAHYEQEDGVCKNCESSRPPEELARDQDESLLWVFCEKCESWLHAICVRDKLNDMGIKSDILTKEILEEVEFFCCPDE